MTIIYSILIVEPFEFSALLTLTIYKKNPFVDCHIKTKDKRQKWLVFQKTRFNNLE